MFFPAKHTYTHTHANTTSTCKLQRFGSLNLHSKIWQLEGVTTVTQTPLTGSSVAFSIS